MNSAPSATKPTNNDTQAPPIVKIDGENLVREAFNDIALVIGGVAVLHHIDDDLTWTLMKRLDRIRVRLLRDLKGNCQADIFEPSAVTPPRVHPAVDEFLIRNRAGMGE
jgi:hypothetical protein